jgi:cytoskeletal protein CcmA (bactofilin family)
MLIAKIKSTISSLLTDSSNEKIEIFSNLNSTPTILANDLTIEGSLSSKGLIEVEGYVKGNISSKMTIIREGGVVDGDLFSESINIKGKFTGNIKAKNVLISKSATISGLVEYFLLSVEDGACIDGQFKKIG